VSQPIGCRIADDDGHELKHELIRMLHSQIAAADEHDFFFFFEEMMSMILQLKPDVHLAKKKKLGVEDHTVHDILT